MRRLIGILMFVSFAASANAMDKLSIIGTWRLVSATKQIVGSNEIVSAYGPHPSGWITYDKSGRMMVVGAYDGRPKRADVDKISDADRIKLFNTFFAYAGTYTFDGKTVTHHIDTSLNEAWTGTSKIREVEASGDKLIYTTKPQMSPGRENGRSYTRVAEVAVTQPNRVQS